MPPQIDIYSQSEMTEIFLSTLMQCRNLTKASNIKINSSLESPQIQLLESVKKVEKIFLIFIL